MRISVVLASYNGTKYIAEQLDSLRLQTRPADELIIRDDCSTDDTYALCEEYIRRYALDWKLVKASQNGGYRENFRAGVALATGDWIILCDQDDIWEHTKIQRFEEIAQQNLTACGIACSFSCIDGQGALIALPPAPGRANHGLIPFEMPSGVSKLPVSRHPELFFVQNIAMGCCMAFSKPVCERYLRLTECGFPHDWELALIASLMGDIFYTDEPLIQYRLHGKNTIGLPGLFPENAPKRPSGDGRIKVMDEFDGLLASAQRILADLGKPPLSPRYNAYSKLRREALTKKNPFKWLALHRYADIYFRMFTMKQRLGDLYVILKH